MAVIFILPDFNTLANTSQQGLPLSDALSCSVHEIRNGLFDLTLTYPVNGLNAQEIVPNAIIKAVPRPGADWEPFRIYEVQRTLNGVMTARANHIAYDLDGAIVWGMTRTGIGAVISRLNALCPAHFEIVNSGIIDASEEFNVVVPITVWSAIGGSNSLLSHFGGELGYHWDDFYKKCVVTIYGGIPGRGAAFVNTVIRYGLNITALNHKKSVADMYSNVMAFWSDGQNAANNVWSSDTSTGVTDRDRYLIIDCSKDFQTAPTQADLNAIVTKYLAANQFTAKDDLAVEYIPVEDTTDNIDCDPLLLCDTVHIDASAIGFSANAKCVEVVYDVLAERYSKVTIGTLLNTIIDTVDQLTRSV